MHMYSHKITVVCRLSTVKNYEKPYKGFYVKICHDGVTALSDVSGEYLKLRR